MGWLAGRKEKIMRITLYKRLWRFTGRISRLYGKFFVKVVIWQSYRFKSIKGLFILKGISKFLQWIHGATGRKLITLLKA